MPFSGLSFDATGKKRYQLQDGNQSENISHWFPGFLHQKSEMYLDRIQSARELLCS